MPSEREDTAHKGGFTWRTTLQRVQTLPLFAGEPLRQVNNYNEHGPQGDMLVSDH